MVVRTIVCRKHLTDNLGLFAGHEGWAVVRTPDMVHCGFCSEVADFQIQQIKGVVR